MGKELPRVMDGLCCVDSEARAYSVGVELLFWEEYA